MSTIDEALTRRMRMYTHDDGALGFAKRQIGRTITVHRRRDGWRCGQPGRVMMVAPSQGRPCWLVEYPDGAHDVVPVADPGYHYTLH
jgi:hypothetical protein